jgi:hypothetical protein
MEVNGEEFRVAGEVRIEGEDGGIEAFGHRADEEVNDGPLDAASPALVGHLGGSFVIGSRNGFLIESAQGIP